MTQCMLTTVDNPYDPFDQYDEWLDYDLGLGYNSSAYLARVAKTSDQLSEKENDREIDRAIDEIIKYDPFNIYIRVTKDNNSTDN